MQADIDALLRDLPDSVVQDVSDIASVRAPEPSVARVIQAAQTQASRRSRTVPNRWVRYVAVVGVVVAIVFMVNQPINILAPIQKMIANHRYSKLKQPSTDPKLEAQRRNDGLTLAVDYADRPVGLAAAYYTASEWPGTEEAQSALRLVMHAAESMPLDNLADGLAMSSSSQETYWRPVARALVNRAKAEANHPRAAKLLSEAAGIYWPRNQQTNPPEELVAVADLIRQKHTDSPDLANFCEVAGNLGNPAPWTQAFEPHIREILATNTHRFVRCQAHFALASIVRGGGIDRQPEAIALYRQFLDDFDGTTKYHAASVERFNRGQCEWHLAALKTHGLGMPSPQTSGLDLKGKPLSLDDFRGRVVLVSFWSTWCRPCLEGVSSERRLLEDFGESDFAIVGMCGDSDFSKAGKTAERYGITWPSFRMAGEGAVEPKWPSVGFPSFYLLNREGVIVDSWLGMREEADLREAIAKLI